MQTSYYEFQAKTEIRMRDEEATRQYEMDRLAHIVTRTNATGVGGAWASVTAGLGRLTEMGSQAVRSALTKPSRPNEECC